MTEDQPLMSTNDLEETTYSSPIDVNSEIEQLKQENEAIIAKHKEILQNKEKIFETRHSSSTSVTEMKNNLRILLRDLRRLEQELKALQVEQYRRFESALRLDEIGLGHAFPKFYDDSKGRKRRSSSGNVLKPGQSDVTRHRSGSSSSNSSVSPRTSPRSSSNAAMQNWDSVLGLMNSASQWKRFWEQRKQVSQANKILENTREAKITKEEILQLRRTLYMLKQKKNLSAEEESLKTTLEDRLKDLEQEFKEQLKSEM